MGLPLRWKHWIGFTLLATTTSLLAYHLGSLAAAARRRQEQPVPLQVVNGLYIEPQSLDLGEVWESPRHTFPLTIENVGNVPRTISGFATTCGCLELDPEGQTIPPGGKVEFAAHLDLMNRLSYQTGVAQWDKTIRLDPVFVGDLQPTRGWEVKCTVRSRVSFNTTNLAFLDCRRFS